MEYFIKLNFSDASGIIKALYEASEGKDHLRYYQDIASNIKIQMGKQAQNKSQVYPIPEPMLKALYYLAKEEGIDKEQFMEIAKAFAFGIMFKNNTQQA